MTAVSVGIGGAFGAVARYLIGLAVDTRAADTLLVNVLGSLALGFLIGADFDGTVMFAAGVGFCGAFTTFSSFAVETVRLAEDGHRSAAVSNAVGTVVAAVVAVSIGLTIGGIVAGG